VENRLIRLRGSEVAGRGTLSVRRDLGATTSAIHPSAAVVTRQVNISPIVQNPPICRQAA